MRKYRLLPVVASFLLACTSTPQAPQTAVVSTKAPSRVSFVDRENLAAKPFLELRKITVGACSVNLRRPLNTEDPLVNPPEARAREQILRIATRRGADAVVDLRCYNMIAIGFGCPVRVECDATPVAYETAFPQ